MPKLQPRSDRAIVELIGLVAIDNGGAEQIRDLRLGHGALLAEHQVLDRVSRGEKPEKILRAEHAVEELNERLLDPGKVVDRAKLGEWAHVGAEQHVDEDDEHAITRVRRLVEPGALRRGIGALDIGGEGLELDEVEALDLLRLAVLEDLEVVCLEPLDDLAVPGGICIDSDEVSPAAKDRALLGSRRRRWLRRPGHRAAEQRHRADTGDQAHNYCFPPPFESDR